MKRSVLIIFILSITNLIQLKAIEFSEKEKSIIYTNAVKVLTDYQSIINQMGEFVVNDIEKAKSSSESFLELFVNRQVLLYNDLDPSHKLSEFYEAETYTSNIILWYPDGLSVKLDIGNARVSEIMSHDESVFSIDIMTRKTIDGNYLNQTMNKNTEELTFRIAFGLENKSFGNFRIVGVRNASSNYVIDYSKALKEVNSEEFNAEDMSKIQSELKNILRDYTNFLSLIGDPQEQTEDKEFYKTSFSSLFTSTDTKVYNDITPQPQTSLIAVTDYLAAYVTDYPNGIRNLSINADSSRFGKVMKNEDGSYYTYIDADKFFSGSFKGKEVFRENFPLIFKINFNAAGKTFTDFKISSVDISAVNFYEATDGSEVEQKPEIIIRPVTRKGLGMSFTASFGQTQINSQNISSMSISENSHSWNISPLYGYLTSLGVSYFLTDNIAVKSGLEFNKFAAKFNLDGTFTDDVLSKDVNLTSYNKIVEASYDSLVTINFVTIPLLVNYTSGKPGKFGFYGEGGVKVSIPVKASYSATGDIKTAGSYPNSAPFPEYLDLAELGFSTRENIDETGKIEMKGFTLSIYSSAGINIPLGYYSSINIGPEITIGLSDLMNESYYYRDIFRKPYKHEPVKVKNFGIRISLAYKL